MALSVNGREYAWGSIAIRVNGQAFEGIRGIDYTTEQEKEYLRGAGNKPIGIQRGNEDNTGTLRMLQVNVVDLSKTVSTGRLTDIRNAQVVVTYTNDRDEVVTDIINGVEFTNHPKGLNQGEMSGEKELTFMFLSVQYNA